MSLGKPEKAQTSYEPKPEELPVQQSPNDMTAMLRQAGCVQYLRAMGRGFVAFGQGYKLMAFPSAVGEGLF